MRFSDNPKKEGAKCLRRPIGPRDHLDVNLDSYINGYMALQVENELEYGKMDSIKFDRKISYFGFSFYFSLDLGKRTEGSFLVEN